MNSTVKWVLLSLNLNEFTHVSIRQHMASGLNYLGGGSVASVLSRFGDREIADSCIIENALIIYVK